MRYHWGLAIGHTYTHTRQASTSCAVPAVEAQNQEDEEPITDVAVEVPIETTRVEAQNNEEPDDVALEAPTDTTGNEPEFSLENTEDECLHEDDPVSDDDAEESGDGDVDPISFSEMYE